jgi:hypothetical protein
MRPWHQTRRGGGGWEREISFAIDRGPLKPIRQYIRRRRRRRRRKVYSRLTQ